MKRGRYSARQMALLLIPVSMAMAQAPPPQLTALQVGQAKIAAIKGEVIFRSPQGDTLGSQLGSVLPPETVVETGKGSAVLDLQDGSQAQVKPHSRVVLKDSSQAKGFSLELFLGRVMAKIQKRLGNTPSFRMGTPTAVITVRGTEFEVDVSKKGTTSVYVYDGIVEVAGLGSLARPVLLRPGFRTDVEHDRPPTVPRNVHEMERESGPGRGLPGRDDTSGEHPSSTSGDDRQESSQPSSDRDH